MTIDRLIAPGAPRIDMQKGTSASAGTTDSEGVAPEDAASSFASMLNTMANGMPELATDAAGSGGIPAAASGLPQQDLTDPPIDAGALLAQMAGGLPAPESAAPALASLPKPDEIGAAGSAPALGRDQSAALGLLDPARPGGRPLGRDTAAVAPGAPDPGDPALLGETRDAGAAVDGGALQVSGAGRKGLGTDARRGGTASLQAADATTQAGGVSGRSGELPGHRDAVQLASALSTDRGVLAAANGLDPAHGGFRALPALRSMERQAARSVFLPLDGSAEASAAGVGATTYGSVQASAGGWLAGGGETPMAASATGELAHKVHYWVTRGVQNAELQLEALGGSAVDVSITLQGKEALVEFRTDQGDARRVLQEAMPQLRDMLRSEGLQLAGSFVGTSAQQGQAERDREPAPRGGGRISMVAAEGVQAPATLVRGGASTTRTLDVFV
ncbi:MAG: flagellar hook-length control protein FliK [Rhodoferax sp.]